MDDFTFGRTNGDASVPATSVKPNTALALLYALELHTLSGDHAQIARPFAGQPDRWWVAVDGEAQGIFTFKDALRLLLDGLPHVAVLHESKAEEDPAPWVGLNYQPWWSHRGTAIAWTAGFWTVCALLGWAFVCLISPFRFQKAAEILYWLSVAAVAIKLCAAEQVAAIRSQFTRLLRRSSPPAPIFAEREQA
ncbi:MAG TPA: hypothetical protein VF593_07195 [Chthoniobacteraceae bacterium]|jgi:hypothetical protein